MLFLWSDEKDWLNLRKHKISFELASCIFEDQHLITELDNRYPYLEERWCSIGQVDGLLIVVIHTVENENGEEIIRIISARKANQKEARRYSHDR